MVLVRRSALWLLMVGLTGAVAPEHAEADLYLCKTPKGDTVSGAVPPPDCVDGSLRVIRPNGAVEAIAPKPTPEQLKKREEDEKQQREQAERSKEQIRRKSWLLDKFKSEAAIESARNRELAAQQARITAARKVLENLARERKKLEEDAEFYLKREMPASLKNALEANSARRATQEGIIDDAKAAMDGVNKRYDEILKTFRELTNPGARPGAPAEKK